jgi:hypothetical protein
MNKYDKIHDLIEAKLGTIDSQINQNKFPLTYLTLADDTTDEVTGYEHGLSKNYLRKARFYLYYQDKYDNNTNNESVIKTSIYDKSDELEILLTTGDFKNEYIHKVSNIEKYRIYTEGLVIISNQAVVSGNLGMIFIELVINYTQNFK